MSALQELSIPTEGEFKKGLFHGHGWLQKQRTGNYLVVLNGRFYNNERYLSAGEISVAIDCMIGSGYAIFKLDGPGLLVSRLAISSDYLIFHWLDSINLADGSQVDAIKPSHIQLSEFSRHHCHWTKSANQLHKVVFGS